ncbi:2-succinyl-5-enolpyruvyl-6-hydroxy-3-cyclohexene-1-carboxylic-acid synthase [Enterovibrio calviensis]|uniref:2-succinyl-5-enolpyruvyl-6-hydroxy-3- cyclohexene-1-carboxylic-acid synthase n=1 Tax=Enterovibrio calviensis TaxID=91359 RepID=UPI0006874AD5|nr:2-succinyl-5-enolpyruvyl-6-hydroxy-3-cyclohexene-1-carboxylic-acid synthase [Enterovibrio calviensis]
MISNHTALSQGTLNQVTLNRIWSRLVLTSLVRSGVVDICIAPGSRSTPLTLEAECLKRNNPNITLHTHFDERGLGFLALGLAKASQRPVAVIVTSGTAVANLLPAVAESGLTREKLVLLTADRPSELIQCGANQAIGQKAIFGEHADQFCDLPSPTQTITPTWLLSLLSEALHQQRESGGSLHVNCPFPEPLYGDMDDASQYLAPVLPWLDGDKPYLSFTRMSPCLEDVNVQWQHVVNKQGVLIAGRMTQGDRKAVQVLADQLGWPLLTDPQAGQGSDYAGFDVWLQNPACVELLKRAECLVQFGSRLVSKRLGQFIASFEGDYWLVDEHQGRLDPSHKPAYRVIAAPSAVANTLTERTRQMNLPQPVNSWASELANASQQYLSLLQERNCSSSGVSEVAFATDSADWITPDCDVFIGNSMAIRLLDMCACLPDVSVFANRGASGIDGLIASAAGVQRTRQKAMLCLLGDTSALYDLNSLALLANNPHPLVMVVINNNGGGIFDMLPVPEAEKDTYYRMPHGVEFSHAAAMFGLGYANPTTLMKARETCLEALNQTGTTVIELTVPSGECGRDLKALFEAVRHANLL